MKTIKQFIATETKTLSVLTLLSAFSVLLLLFRIKLTQSHYFLFLVWNLFLAGVPYLISSYLATLKQINTISLIILSGIWLLFLPNAPYIITDLFHLRYSSTDLIWLDTLIIVVFAITGLFLFFKSVLTMESIFKTYVEKRMVSLSLPLLFILVGFGVYLGRFLRFNSWEIINKPYSIIETIFNIVMQPKSHTSAWLFTLCFGLFLGVFYYVFKLLHETKKAS
ncbi:DUF1361 domain-containing protein [Psychroserpens sp. NJDZ02]|uniref:DUF1361 domain-containing protein n=1 Tax=Psychroserpens sp. NJDZ02 TaxID=2570561 RepID=UPI0010A8DC23|nr:DUF1361 domain-containing protein [Psychroserpens sp. NJDZ02]QCE41846.1 DUF1361 domain-containing protein [Psychroserpens sp. NJDZ02]